MLDYDKKLELLQRHVKQGDLVTYTHCLGTLGECRFTRWETNATGRCWLVGHATRTTSQYKVDSGLVDDVSVNDVTHVNRESVGYLKLKEELTVAPTN